MATGDSLVYFTALDNQPPAADFATMGVRSGTGDTDGDDMIVMEFVDTAPDEHCQFSGIVPSSWTAASGIDVIIGWMSAQTTGAVRWQTAFKSVTPDADDLDTKAFATAIEANSTTASAAGEVQEATNAHTTAGTVDNLAAGEYFRLRITREASDTGNDTLTGDAQLLYVHLKES